MYTWITIALIIVFVLYRRRVSGYDTSALDALKFKSTITRAKPVMPKKTPVKSPKPIDLRNHPEIKKLQQQTVEYKNVLEKNKAQEKEIIQTSAKQIALENSRRNQLVKAEEAKAAQQVNEIITKGTTESAQVLTSGQSEAQRIQQQANIEAARLRREAEVEAQKIKQQG